ncbi:MAG: class I SAM-dependent methyltransferase [Defluviitaleaceae bacterium]|nr:class I SAM-dependent methyltransferase [Defluviitaleaceae bacterium]
MHWEHFNPVYSCDKVNHDLLCYSPWFGHRNFAYDYIMNIKPSCVVELGVHYGASFFAFLQAIEDGNLPIELHGIDVWANIVGDCDTASDYNVDIHEAFLETLEGYNKKSAVVLHRKIFDDALSDFADNSIDLLHIDGTHSYEAVLHDYETWLCKLKPDGVILFHDTSETSYDSPYVGSKSSTHAWQEIKVKNDYTLEFDHSYGLGILCLSSVVYEKLKFVELGRYQRTSNRLCMQGFDRLRQNHFKIKDDNTHINFLKEQIDIKKSEIRKYQETIESKDSYVKDLENQASRIKTDYEKTIFGKDEIVAQLQEENSRIKVNYEKTIFGKDEIIALLQEENGRIKTNYEKTIYGKDAFIAQLQEEASNIKTDCEKIIFGKDASIVQLQGEIENFERMVLRNTCKDEGLRNRVKDLENQLENVLKRKKKRFFS